MKRAQRYLANVVLAALVAAPMVLYASRGITDSFSHLHTAAVVQYLAGGDSLSIAGLESTANVPGIIALVLTIDQVTGLTPQATQFLILLGGIVPFIAWSVAYRLSGSWMVSWAATIVITYSFFAPYYSIWPHGYGWALILVFFLLVQEIIARPDPAPPLIAGFLVMFGLNTYSYTAQYWLWVFVAILAVVTLTFLLRGRPTPTDLKVGTHARGLALVFTILFFATNRVLYSNYLPKVATRVDVAQAFAQFVGRYGRFIPGLGDFGADTTGPLSYVSVAPRFVQITNLSYLVFCAVLLAGTAVFLGSQAWRRRAPTWMPAIALGLLGICAFDIFGYGAYKVILLRSIFFAAPVALALVAGRTKPRHFVAIALLFAVLSVASFSLNWAYGDQIDSVDHYRGIDYGARWYQAYVPNGSHPLSDHHTMGRLYIAYSSSPGSFTPAYYTPENYATLLSGGIPEYNGPVSHVLVNKEQASHRMLTLDWGDLKALGANVSRVGALPERSVIYESGRTEVVALQRPLG